MRVSEQGAPTLAIMETQTGQILVRLADSSRYFNSVAFTPDGCCVVAGGEGNAIRLWDARSGELLALLFSPLEKKDNRVGPEDVVFVYFAGHGFVQGRRFYLVPHHLGYARPRDQLDAVAINNLASHGISDEELERAFEKLDARRRR